MDIFREEGFYIIDYIPSKLIYSSPELQDVNSEYDLVWIQGLCRDNQVKMKLLVWPLTQFMTSVFIRRKLDAARGQRK